HMETVGTETGIASQVRVNLRWTGQHVSYGQAGTLTAGWFLQDSVTCVWRNSCLHHFTTDWHPMFLRVWVVTDAPVKFASVDVNGFLVIFDGFQHHPMQLSLKF